MTEKGNPAVLDHDGTRNEAASPAIVQEVVGDADWQDDYPDGGLTSDHDLPPEWLVDDEPHAVGKDSERGLGLVRASPRQGTPLTLTRERQRLIVRVVCYYAYP